MIDKEQFKLEIFQMTYFFKLQLHNIYNNSPKI